MKRARVVWREGPLVVSALILPSEYINAEIKDSKKLTALQCAKLSAEIITIAISYTIEIISVEMVEKLNPKQAKYYWNATSNWQVNS
ncbi:hypothetical protein [Spiroplasma endosymbiont of Polydrusus pterygomalis]|uniref:hypothetical protein n=1 Tax=Spiroplasma endosymbiont of Polydrusus pterygomalis TaxID=3139327 RepID=UPI003CCAC7F9